MNLSSERSIEQRARSERDARSAHVSMFGIGDLLRNLPTAAALVRSDPDHSWIVLDANAAFSDMVTTGSPESVRGDPLSTYFAFTSPQSSPSFTTQRAEIRAHTRVPSGAPLRVVVTFSEGVRVDPRLRLVFVQGEDWSAIEAAYRRSREQFRDFFNDSPDINYVLDPEGRLVDINETGALQLGYTREEVLSGRVTPRVHEGDRPLVDDRFRRVMQGEVHRLEARFVRRDGSLMLVSILARPNTQDGEVIGLVGVAQDITEQRATQIRLEESEQRYRALFVNHVDAVITTDLEGHILYANPAFERMIGMDLPELRDTHYLPLVAPELQDHTSRQFGQATQGRTVEYETRILDCSQNGIDLHVALVPVTVDNSVREIHCIAKNITALKSIHSDLERMAFTHRLTGLPNRNALDEHLAHLVRLGSMFSVLNLDLDRLKAVNDRFGRSFGDALLRAVANRLRGHVTDPDRLFQYSGDNFVIVHRHSRDEDAFAYAANVEKLVRAPFALSGEDIVISASIGVCVFPEYGHDPESLLRRSEDAMLEAKKRGRRHIAFYRELTPDDDSRLLKLEFGLPHALGNGELALVYQPQTDAQTGALHGAEALLRWTHPELGPVPPTEFIPIAERNGLIHEIGMWVIEQACHQLRRWDSLGRPDLRLAVNVSIDQLHDAEFADGLLAALRAKGANPSSLVIEVTESIAANADVAVGQLRALKEFGIGIAIDDFGTGYSSLRYLQDFPVDYLKIDRSFVDRLEEREEDRNLVATIIGLARSFGLDTIAEGVETAEQARILRNHEVTLMQGFHIGRPVTADQFNSWVRCALD